MPVTRKDVEHVARLARLALSEDEKERFTAQLGAIVGYVEKLNELDTEKVEPTAHILPLRNVTRPDTARPPMGREAVVKLAPKSGGGFIRVPQVIE